MHFAPHYQPATNAMLLVAVILALLAALLLLACAMTSKVTSRPITSVRNAKQLRSGPGLAVGKKVAPMETEERDDTDDEEVEQLEAWRYLMLHGLGFAPDDILQLLKDPYFDWHEANLLLEQGYTHKQAIWLLERVN